MNRRSISDQIRTWLLQEMEVWRAGGILSADQPGRILDLYETPEEAARRKHSLALFVLCSLAAVMVGAAALLLVGYNWAAMPASGKLSILFGAILICFGAAYRLRFHSEHQLTSEILFFLNGVFYGVGIWQVAQIFHIQSHYPDGVWLWALGVLPLALCLDTLLLHALYVGLLAVWVGTEILGFQGIDPWLFHSWHIHRCAATLPLLALPGLYWAYRKKSMATVGLYVPLLAWWFVLQPVAWDWEFGVPLFVGLAGALMLLVAEMHRPGSLVPKPYRFWGVLISAGILVPLSFSEFLFEVFRDSPAKQKFILGLIMGVLGGVGILAASFF